MSESSERNIDSIEHCIPIPADCIPVKAVEIMVYLNSEGVEEIGCRWQGTKNIVLELGMVEYAKLMIADERMYSEPEKDNQGDDHPDQ